MIKKDNTTNEQYPSRLEKDCLSLEKKNVDENKIIIKCVFEGQTRALKKKDHTFSRKNKTPISLSKETHKRDRERVRREKVHTFSHTL